MLASINIYKGQSGADNPQRGVMPRVFQHLCAHMEREQRKVCSWAELKTEKEKVSGNADGTNYNSFLEARDTI